MKEDLNKWNALWKNHLYGMKHEDHSAILCYFHGIMTAKMEMGTASISAMVDGMQKAIEQNSKSN